MEIRQNIVLFGITGDLAHIKLIPAIYELFKKKYSIRVIGIARRDLRRDEFINVIKNSLSINESEEEVFQKFISETDYINGDFKEEQVYARLKKILGNNDEANTIFYFSVPQFVYKDILYGLNQYFELKNSKIAIEKPFGDDLNTFEELLETLGRYSDMKKIYPVDHYLGKEWIHNVTSLQRNNPILSGIWGSSNLDSIELSMLEQDGIKERGRFYEQVGTLKDVFQNHLLQILSLVLKPLFPTSTKSEIIETINPPLGKEEIVIAQYTKNKDIKGYKEEEYVAKDSSTESYFAVKLHLPSLPIYVRSGKRLTKNSTYLVLNLKDKYSSSTNWIKYNFQPDKNIEFMLYAHGEEVRGVLPVNYADKSYEILIAKMILGERGDSFPEINEMRAAWRLTEAIENKIKNKKLYMKEYKALSHGPKEADKLLEIDHRKWN